MIIACSAAFVLFILGIWAQCHTSADKSELLEKVPLLPMLAGTAAAVFVMLLPGEAARMAGEFCCAAKAVLVALQHTFQMFLLNGDYGMFLDGASCLSEDPPGVYLLFGAALALIAAILMAGTILALLGDVYMYGRLLAGWGKTVYVFSVLDNRSVLLAESCRESISGNAVLLFVNAVNEGDDSYRDSLARLHAVTVRAGFDSGALQFFLRHMKEKNIFVMADDETENLKESLRLISICENWGGVRIYAFADSEEAELLLGAASKKLFDRSGKRGITLRRVNPYRSLVYNHLYSEAKTGDIFKNKENNKKESYNNDINNEVNDGENKSVFSVLILGLGRYGSELVKAFPWYVQLPGYHLQIHVFEKDPERIAAFCAECSELLDRSDDRKPGEAHYTIRIYNKDTGIDLFSPDFANEFNNVVCWSCLYGLTRCPAIIRPGRAIPGDTHMGVSAYLTRSGIPR